MILDTVSAYIAGAAGLGTAAFTLVDGSKAFGGGVSNCGFGHIERAVGKFFPAAGGGPLSLADVRATLRANWLNGTPFADQKAIAKSLIKLRLDADNAPHLARSTGVDGKVLGAVAGKIATGKPLTIGESDVYGRFDLMLTAILDEGYQRADQVYRNSAKAWSVAVAVGLAIAGVCIVEPSVGAKEWAEAIVVGLAATPLAPIAKDLTSALQAGVKVAQLIGK
jgi:hypothetical protein